MLRIYRGLLLFYPARYREEFGCEMITVLEELHAEASSSSMRRFSQFLRETAGLVGGAIREHLRTLGGHNGWASFPIRRFTMHAEFRFPKSTPVLMTLILAGIVLAIEKGQAIQASLPHVNPPIGPIQPSQHAFVSGILWLFLFFYALGFVGWAILYVLRRSGMHRLAEMSADEK